MLAEFDENAQDTNRVGEDCGGTVVEISLHFVVFIVSKITNCIR